MTEDEKEANHRKSKKGKKQKYDKRKENIDAQAPFALSIWMSPYPPRALSLESLFPFVECVCPSIPPLSPANQLNTKVPGMCIIIILFHLCPFVRVQTRFLPWHIHSSIHKVCFLDTLGWTAMIVVGCVRARCRRSQHETVRE